MFPMTPIATALALFFCAASGGRAYGYDNTPRSLLAQAKGLASSSEEQFL